MKMVRILIVLLFLVLSIHAKDRYIVRGNVSSVVIPQTVTVNILDIEDFEIRTNLNISDELNIYKIVDNIDGTEVITFVAL